MGHYDHARVRVLFTSDQQRCCWQLNMMLRLHSTSTAGDKLVPTTAHLGCWVLHLQEFEDGGTVVRDRHVPNIVHEHLRQPRGPRMSMCMRTAAPPASPVPRSGLPHLVKAYWSE